MKLGLGLYRHMLTPANFAFAVQAGATHVVAHLVDYFPELGDDASDDQPLGGDRGWGRAGDPDALWTVEELTKVRTDIEAAGLRIAAIENLDPAHWHGVLLDGPEREAHTENVKTIIRRMGEAGIPMLGYNFSLAGVAGRSRGPWARGGAESVGMEGVDETPLPRGMAWNMVVDEAALATGETAPSVSSDQLWDRYRRFLDAVLPVAESAGVALAAHPDDPPVPRLRDTPRLVWEPDGYGRLLEQSDSPAHRMEFCVGSLAEMPGADIHDVVERYAATGRIGYVHFRNVVDRAPHYKESFVDDGDVDMLRVVKILDAAGFDGVLIPDHTPSLTCDAPWHAGMAYAMGFMRAALDGLPKRSA